MYESVCFIQFSSSRVVKSSRACAPRLSLRASAENIVCAPCTSRFCSSSVSTRSVFQIIERSVTPTSSILAQTSTIFEQPSSSLSWMRKTAAWPCITCCSSARIWAVGMGPEALRSLSMLASVASPAPAGMSRRVSPGLAISATRLAQARPKTTMSSSELAPSRLAPCTDAHADSPAASNPGTIASGLSLVGLSTSPKWLVGMPPML
mmetsp:Transcript_23863/g.51455  ORF Transcript_23863/g.51455 Transcript_23863/m.51455 type:complete len:207 (-) Transcript_23863:1161-1781(-)